MIIAKSKLRQFIGLMFQRPKDLLFVFDKEKVVTLHMFFVFYPIYMIFLDRNKKIISFKRAYPFQPLIISPKCMYILETKNFRPGDKLNLTKIND